MFERFTDRARQVMALANQEAFVLQHEIIDVPHVALALIREGAGVGAQILRNLGVDGQAIRTRILRELPKGQAYAPKPKLSQTQAARQVIVDAIYEAKRLGHKYVGTEHILLGLLRGTGLTAEALTAAGATLDRARTELKKVLDHRPKAGQSGAPDDGARDGLEITEEHFSARARQAMALANQEALRFHHEYIGTEHILLGIVKGTGVGANVLKDLGLDLRKVRLEVEKVVKFGPEPVPIGVLPMTPVAKQAIAYAAQEARELNHHYVGTEHLLLGLVRERDGVAGVVLLGLGVELDHARASIQKLLGSNPHGEVSPASSLRADCELCRRLGEMERWPHSGIAVMLETVAVLGDNQGCPGWCVLILKDHVEHLDDLPAVKQARIFLEVARIAAAIRRVFPTSGKGGGPPRINYECLGNLVPHVHWHVIPRHADDPEPTKPVWGWPEDRLKGSMNEAQRKELVEKLRSALATP